MTPDNDGASGQSQPAPPADAVGATFRRGAEGSQSDSGAHAPGGKVSKAEQELVGSATDGTADPSAVGERGSTGGGRGRGDADQTAVPQDTVRSAARSRTESPPTPARPLERLKEAKLALEVESLKRSLRMGHFALVAGILIPCAALVLQCSSYELEVKKAELEAERAERKRHEAEANERAAQDMAADLETAVVQIRRLLAEIRPVVRAGEYDAELRAEADPATAPDVGERLLEKVDEALGPAAMGPRLQESDLADLGGDDDSVMRVHFIDVGQGDSTLFEFPCGAMLVDTGAEMSDEFDGSALLRDYLDAFFARRTDLARLDSIVLTHPHRDHVQDAFKVAEKFSVKNVVDNGHADGTRAGSAFQRELRRRATEELGAEALSITLDQVSRGGLTTPVIDPFESCRGVDPKVKVLWGGLDDRPPEWDPHAFQNANNHSVVLRVDFGESSVLLTGDLESGGPLEQFLRTHQDGGVLDADVYQTGHHGSLKGTTPQLLAAIAPQLAVMSVGDPSRRSASFWTARQFGQPRHALVQLLADREIGVTAFRRPVAVPVGMRGKPFSETSVGRAIYATGWDGTVVVTATAEGQLSVATERFSKTATRTRGTTSPGLRE